MISEIEHIQLNVLDVLIENGGYWTAGDGRVLIELARTVYDDDTIDSKDGRYKRVSLAVLMLERDGFVEVERRYTDQPERANIVEGITLV